MPYGARRGRCAFRHSIWQAASSRSATSRLFIAAVIRASRRSPSPRGGRRNHRAAGRPQIARLRATPRAALVVDAGVVTSGGVSLAINGTLLSDRPPLPRRRSDEVGTDHRITTAPGPPTAPLLASWPSDPRAGDIARNAPAALTPSRGVRVQTWVRPKRAPATAAREAGTSSAVGVGPTFVLDLARACGSGLATTSRTRLRASPH